MSTRSSKRDIAKARQEKAAAKRERRQGEVETASDVVDEPAKSRSEDEVLAALAVLHERFENGTLSFTDFEADKADLMRSLNVD